MKIISKIWRLQDLRLDEVLPLLFDVPSRSQAEQLIEKGAVFVNGSLQKKRYKV
jgi:RNA-binding protein YlmH